MKIITLNTWGGRVKDPLMSFLKVNKDVDVFCLQEIFHQSDGSLIEEGDRRNLFLEIGEVLENHKGFFRPSIEGYGLAMFIPKDVVVTEEGDIVIHEVESYTDGANHPRNLQYICFEKEGVKYIIANVHGIWNGQGKTDTEDRIKQSNKIQNFLEKFVEYKKIVCGDFNLAINTESVSILENKMKNMIREYKISSTRTSLYTKSERHADYIFISPDIKVRNFEVLTDEVSDHAPLLLEI